MCPLCFLALALSQLPLKIFSLSRLPFYFLYFTFLKPTFGRHFVSTQCEWYSFSHVPKRALQGCFGIQSKVVLLVLGWFSCGSRIEAKVLGTISKASCNLSLSFLEWMEGWRDPWWEVYFLPQFLLTNLTVAISSWEPALALYTVHKKWFHLEFLVGGPDLSAFFSLVPTSYHMIREMPKEKKKLSFTLVVICNDDWFIRFVSNWITNDIHKSGQGMFIPYKR